MFLSIKGSPPVILKVVRLSYILGNQSQNANRYGLSGELLGIMLSRSIHVISLCDIVPNLYAPCFLISLCYSLYINYSNPKATRYKYRLLGFEQQWINAGDATRATYTNLPPGQYQLQIIASSSDELWSKPYQVEINVKPAPWNTWWAYLAYAVIIALSLLLYAKALNRKLLQEQQQKEGLGNTVQR